MEIAEFMFQNEGADDKAWNGQEAVEIFRKSETGEFDVILYGYHDAYYEWL